MNKQNHTEFDAVVIGSGPNGLAAAITLQQYGLSVLVLEAKPTIGGGMRTAELTLPGFRHDICSAVHPLAMASPFFQSQPLAEFGLEFIQPPIAAAHPLDDGTAAVLQESLQFTAESLGADKEAYLNNMLRLHQDWPKLAGKLLSPLGPANLSSEMIRFGLTGMQPAKKFSARFSSEPAKALIAGVAAHSMLPLDAGGSAAFALVLMLAAHNHGWPFPVGGSQSIADALGKRFMALGGTIQTDSQVTSLAQLPDAKAILFDTSPREMETIAGSVLSPFYRWQLNRFKAGPGVFKIDWALDGPIPFRSPFCNTAGTIHLGGSFAEIAASEKDVTSGIHPENPFVILAQPSRFDTTRAPAGKETAWAYCHVPNGSAKNMTAQIEAQVERFAPGFRDRIIGRHTYTAMQMETYNSNYMGGDISCGRSDLLQLFARPALRWSPYRTSKKGLYICSAATPPGGGVHGMCGYHAANRAIKDIFT